MSDRRETFDVFESAALQRRRRVSPLFEVALSVLEGMPGDGAQRMRARRLRSVAEKRRGLSQSRKMSAEEERRLLLAALHLAGLEAESDLDAELIERHRRRQADMGVSHRSVVTRCDRIGG